jgi:carbon monoxide dehydrogenase subunit G
MGMKLEGEYVFNGPRPKVWDMVRDPNALASCLPGTQKLTQISDCEYEGEINIRIGPVSGSFSGLLTVSDEMPPESCTLTVEGKGVAGFAKGVGHVNLVDNGNATTTLKYTGELNIGGRLASVGQRMLDSVGKSMIRQGFESLDKELAKRMGTVEANEKPVQDLSEVTDAKELDRGEHISTLFQDGRVERKWYQIAEVRMLMYVVPVALTLAAFVYLVTSCSGR